MVALSARRWPFPYENTDSSTFVSPICQNSRFVPYLCNISTIFSVTCEVSPASSSFTTIMVRLESYCEGSSPSPTEIHVRSFHGFTSCTNIIIKVSVKHWAFQSVKPSPTPRSLPPETAPRRYACVGRNLDKGVRCFATARLRRYRAIPPPS